MEQEIDDQVVMHLEQRQQQKPASIAVPLTAMACADAGTGPDTRFAVTAPYWLNGLHNKEGMALADEINKLIASKKLEEEKEAIEQILDTYPAGKKLGLSVVSERTHLDDHHRKMNLAEPSFLLDGAFVRDKNGEYRPKEGGLAVLVDKGDSLVLKNKDSKSYEAAVELAKSKGWTAISLTGKPAMMESAWIAAKLAGIEVINYEPTKEAKAKFADRLAERQASMEIHQAAACVSSGIHDGKIISVDGGQAVQKIGRDPDVTVRHDISKLSRVPDVGEAAYIVYDKSGRGIVKERAHEKALGR